MKQGWTLRTEAIFNDPTDVQPTEALATRPHLREALVRLDAAISALAHADADETAAPALPQAARS